MKKVQGFVPGRHLSIKFTGEDEDLMARILEVKALAPFISMSVLLKILLKTGIGPTTKFFQNMESGGVGSVLELETEPRYTRPNTTGTGGQTIQIL
jgi:hypothetical protein